MLITKGESGRLQGFHGLLLQAKLVPNSDGKNNVHAGKKSRRKAFAVSLKCSSYCGNGIIKYEEDFLLQISKTLGRKG